MQEPRFQKIADLALGNVEMLRSMAMLSRRTPEFRDALDACDFIGMTVSDGTGKERGTVVIEATWGGGGVHGAMLSLWRDTGAVRTNIDELERSPDALKLDFIRSGERLRYVDANVVNGRAYTYYVVIEAHPNSTPYLFAFEKQHHVARTTESRSEFAERKMSEKEISERLAALRPAQEPSPDEMANRLLQEALEQRETTLRVGSWLEKKLDESGLPPDVTERIFWKVMNAVEAARKKK